MTSIDSHPGDPSSLEALLIFDREADHRIANNLALIVSLLRLRARNVSQQAGAMQPADVKMLLEDIAARVETVARLHRMLSGGRGHHWMYDRDSLLALVEAAGFADVEPAEEGRTRIADPGGLDLNEREGDTFCLEARRP